MYVPREGKGRRGVVEETIIPSQQNLEPGEPPSPSPKPEAIRIAYCFNFRVVLPISSCFNQGSFSGSCQKVLHFSFAPPLQGSTDLGLHIPTDAGPTLSQLKP